MGNNITRVPELASSPIDAAARGYLWTENGISEAHSNETPPMRALSCNADAAFLSDEEAARREKLGILLVQLGVASEEAIFGSHNSETMRDFREHRIPDLLRIPPQPGPDICTRAFLKLWKWVAPRWQMGRARARSKSPPVAAHFSVNTARAEEEEKGENNKQKEKEEEEEVDFAEEAAKGWGEGPLGNAPILSHTRRKRSALPQLTLKPLSDDEVDSLTPAARKDREVVLQEEVQIHKLLQSIEDTRYRYLVPSREMICEPQVMAVAKCYEEKNASAQKKRAAMKKQLEMNARRRVKKNVEGEETEAPIVVFDVLACAKVVEELKTCTARMVEAYSAREL
ncbi:unnamed protein product [Phytomonas sp. EM1]|nr:unnamed protein product [Phytomonas sp. EM1]|eukprot:CCW62867.1 unnamed protein product [Phytomonas sp. isolate EM1]